MNIAIIKQGCGKYLFEVPESITLKEGEKVKCDTSRGVTDGIVWADSITADEPAAKLIGKLLGAKFPLKAVVGKTVTSVEMFEQPKREPEKAEPEYLNMRVVCVAGSNGFTVGKLYEFKNGVVVDDDGDVRPNIGGRKITSLSDAFSRNWENKFIEFKGE